MATIQSRLFSKNYSGLINQSVIALGLGVICITAHEIMKRKRRGKRRGNGLGSVETWEFGYLYQGRSWAKNPSPSHPKGWPLSWVPQVINFPEDKFHELRGLDATLYVRFLRGCAWFTLLHTLTTTPILLPIHVHFSDSGTSRLSMTRASISSLVATSEGLELLWIHIILLFWISITWICTIAWVCRGVFTYRRNYLEALAQRLANANATADATSTLAPTTGKSATLVGMPEQYHPHPHPQFPFHSLPANSGQPEGEEADTRGSRLRTVMVTNIPNHLRSEKDLADYFTYYLSRDVDKPAIPFAKNGTVQPGLINKFAAFLFNRVKRLPILPHANVRTDGQCAEEGDQADGENDRAPVVVDRVVIARKMTELSSLLERREDVLKRLETAHIKLARKVLTAVKHAMDRQERERAGSSGRPVMKRFTSKIALDILSKPAPKITEEREAGGTENIGETVEGVEEKDASVDMELLVRELRPFVEEFGVLPLSETKVPARVIHSITASFRRAMGTTSNDDSDTRPFQHLPESISSPRKTIWDVLYSLPRQSLDPYQPLVRLQALFRNRTVPSIDYYTAKLGLLTQLITEARSKKVTDYEPVSTAFVTFGDPKTARRACKYLAVHPSNPLACLVSPAPGYEDLDWTRIMKSSYRAEILKDWVVNSAVWVFTIFWVFPVSSFVALVSIGNISSLWPALNNYLQAHPWEEELIQSLLPTVLVALLSLLIPLILLLISKKAHTIITLSAIHDQIMTRYYKFLIVNVLVFFCVGTATLQSLLLSFSDLTKAESDTNVLQIISDSFPSAGPFYVGWMIFTTGIHGAIELVMFGLPLFVYPSTKRAVTPRRRAVGIRPRTFNYYYWLPNHLLVIHIFVVFSVLNPLVIPFAWVYFTIDSTVVRNQLLHVYAKIYEGNGQQLMIRIIRYSLDGLLLSQFVFLAYMAVLKNRTNVALSAVLVIMTVFVKMIITRICRAKYERDDIMEANIICGTNRDPNDVDLSTSHMSAEAHAELDSEPGSPQSPESPESVHKSTNKAWSTWRLSGKFDFSYANFPHRQHHGIRRQPNPFAESTASFSRLRSDDGHGDYSSGKGQPRRTDHERMQMQNFGVLEQDLADYRADPVSTAASNPTELVSRHPPHPAWDDESDMNHPYDNPYYTRPVNNALWLPRDPCGLLDLDDTVDVKMSLTTLSSAGQLGVWVVPGGPQLMETANNANADPSILSSPRSAYRSSPEPLEPITFAEPGNQFTNNSPYFTRHLDGSEEINLPPAIASRVSAIDKEDDVDYAGPSNRTRRPSLLGYGRKKSSDKSIRTARSSTKEGSFIHRRQTFNIEQPSAITQRTRLTSLASTTFSMDPPSSILGRMHRSGSVDEEMGVASPSSLFVGGAPGSGAGTSAGAGGVGSFGQIRNQSHPMMHANPSNLTIPGPLLTQPSNGTDHTSSGISIMVPPNIGRLNGVSGSSSRLAGLSAGGDGNAHDRALTAVTMQEVVQEEAMVEEQEAADERARKEREEAEKESRQHRSWLTRWLFSNLEDVTHKRS